MNDPFSIFFIGAFASVIVDIIGDFIIKYQQKNVEIWKLKKDIEKLKNQSKRSL